MKTTTGTSGKANATARIYDRSELDAMHFCGVRRRIFPQRLTASEREDAYANALRHEEERNDAKERGKNEAEFVHDAIPVIDGMTALARGEQLKMRKDLAAAEAKVSDTKRREEILASATGYRWHEVATKTYADDEHLEMLTVRMDTFEEVARRRMNSEEADAATHRKQTVLFEH